MNRKLVKPVREKPEPVKSESSTSSIIPAPSFSNKNPAFIEEKWTSIILPTLYHCFFASKDSFGSFTARSDKLVDHVRGALELVFPHHTYEINGHSKVVKDVRFCGFYDRIVTYIAVSQTCARIAEKRSLFGIKAIAVVDAFFNDPKYHGKPDRIRLYVGWALRKNGPALFLKPAPMESELNEDEVGYIVSCSLLPPMQVSS